MQRCMGGRFAFDSSDVRIVSFLTSHSYQVYESCWYGTTQYQHQIPKAKTPIVVEKSELEIPKSKIEIEEYIYKPKIEVDEFICEPNS